MRVLALITSIIVALAVAALPTSMVKDFSSALPASAAHSFHQHHDVEESDLEMATTAQVCASTAACAPVSEEARTDHWHGHKAPNTPSHGGVACCDMSSCHAFMLMAACDLHPAGLKPLRHMRVATLLVPSSFTSRIERPPRFA